MNKIYSLPRKIKRKFDRLSENALLAQDTLVSGFNAPADKVQEFNSHRTSFLLAAILLTWSAAHAYGAEAFAMCMVLAATTMAVTSSELITAAVIGLWVLATQFLRLPEVSVLLAISVVLFSNSVLMLWRRGALVAEEETQKVRKPPFLPYPALVDLIFLMAEGIGWSEMLKPAPAWSWPGDPEQMAAWDKLAHEAGLRTNTIMAQGSPEEAAMVIEEQPEWQGLAGFLAQVIDPKHSYFSLFFLGSNEFMVDPNTQLRASEASPKTASILSLETSGKTDLPKGFFSSDYAATEKTIAEHLTNEEIEHEEVAAIVHSVEQS